MKIAVPYDDGEEIALTESGATRRYHVKDGHVAVADEHVEHFLSHVPGAHKTKGAGKGASEKSTESGSPDDGAHDNAGIPGEGR